MATDGEKIRQLRDFFVGTFTVPELAMFLTMTEYKEVVAALNQCADRNAYSFAVVEALRSRGLIDGAFFEHLKQERPNLGREISRLKELWIEEDQAAPHEVPVGRSLFLREAKAQHEDKWWNGLSAWANAHEPTIHFLRESFESQNYSDETPGVIIFPLPYHQMLDDKEVAAIRSWVERGGGLLVLGYYVANSHHESNISRLTGEWGVRFNDVLLMNPGLPEGETRRQVFHAEEKHGVSLDINMDHAIVHNVKRLVLISSDSLDVSDAVGRGFELKTNASSDVWLPEGPKDGENMLNLIEYYVNQGRQDVVVATAFEYGRGKIAVVGTWKVLTMPYGDNQEFVKNLIGWLMPEDR